MCFISRQKNSLSALLSVFEAALLIEIVWFIGLSQKSSYFFLNKTNTLFQLFKLYVVIISFYTGS